MMKIACYEMCFKTFSNCVKIKNGSIMAWIYKVVVPISFWSTMVVSISFKYVYYRNFVNFY